MKKAGHVACSKPWAVLLALDAGTRKGPCQVKCQKLLRKRIASQARVFKVYLTCLTVSPRRCQGPSGQDYSGASRGRRGGGLVLAIMPSIFLELSVFTPVHLFIYASGNLSVFLHVIPFLKTACQLVYPCRTSFCCLPADLSIHPSRFCLTRHSTQPQTPIHQSVLPSAHPGLL